MGDRDFFFRYLLDQVLDFPNIMDLESDAKQVGKVMHVEFELGSTRMVGACPLTGLPNHPKPGLANFINGKTA